MFILEDAAVCHKGCSTAVQIREYLFSCGSPLVLIFQFLIALIVTGHNEHDHVLFRLAIEKRKDLIDLRK